MCARATILAQVCPYTYLNSLICIPLIRVSLTSLVCQSITAVTKHPKYF